MLEDRQRGTPQFAQPTQQAASRKERGPSGLLPCLLEQRNRRQFRLRAVVFRFAVERGFGFAGGFGAFGAAFFD